VYKSDNCTQNEHGLCEGEVIEDNHGSKTTKICECQCHNNMYQLIRRIQAANNQIY
jgi:hypothetical protein